MDIVIAGKNMELTDAIRSYAQEKMMHLGKYLQGVSPVSVRVELEANMEAKGEPRSTVEITLSMPEAVVRCEEVAPDMYEAIDIAQERIEKKLHRLKEREIDKVKRVDKEQLVAVGHIDAKELKRIIKRKKFDLGVAISEDDAIDRMELLGHDFYFFINSGNGLYSVVYRREDGGYGLIQSE